MTINMDVTHEEMMAIIDDVRASKLKDPITTRHVGTIAFQGTDAQINEAMKKWLGGVK